MLPFCTYNNKQYHVPTMTPQGEDCPRERKEPEIDKLG